MSRHAPPRLAIWGAGGHAKVVAEAVRRAGVWEVAGFLDDQTPERAGEAFAGSVILGGRSALAALREAGVTALHLAFGHNEARQTLGAELAAAGFQLPVVTDPSAVVASSARLGDGCFIGPGAIVNADARLGRHVIVNSGVIVEHDTVVDDAVHLAPRACLAGHVQIGALSFVGAGSVVRDRVRIGRACTVGMGSIVVRDLSDDTLAYGCPAVSQGKSL